MSTQYNQIGTQYAALKSLPSERIQKHGVRAALPSDLSNTSVLDLACGSGYYARLLLGWGARQVTGVDISEEMVAEGKRILKDEGKVEFYVADCSKNLVDAVPGLNKRWGSFDIVLGSWFLNYAPDEASVMGMLRNISGGLKSGGRFIGLIANHAWENDGSSKRPTPSGKPTVGLGKGQVVTWPTEDHSDVQKEPKYGMSANLIEDLPGGTGQKYLITAHTKPEPFSFETYGLRWDIYAKAAEVCGMKHIEFRVPGISDIPQDALEEDGKNAEWWSEFFARPFGPTWCVWICEKV